MTACRTRALWLALGALAPGSETSAQTVTRVSVASNGVQGDFNSYEGDLAADGRFVVFFSSASNLVPSDTNGFKDVFVHDRATGVTELVSVGSGGNLANAHSEWVPGITPDGRYVVFTSTATNLVSGDTNGVHDVFVRDRLLATTVRASLGWDGSEPTNEARVGSISDDGRYVAFESGSSNLVPNDTNGEFDVFVRDLVLGTTERVSVDSAGGQGNAFSGVGFANQSMSGDGRTIAFWSPATNLVAGDTNGSHDIFVRDRVLGTTVRASVDSAGNEVIGTCIDPVLSRDGRVVGFQSYATSLVPGDTNNSPDVFVHDLSTGSTERINVDAQGFQGDSGGQGIRLSADGRWAVFTSAATNLVPGDTNGLGDAFLKDRLTGSVVRVDTSTSGAQMTGAIAAATEVSDDGRIVSFWSNSGTLVAGDTNASLPGSGGDVFVWDSNHTCSVNSYCTWKTTSNGCTPRISSAGAALLTGYDAFFLTATGVLNNKLGLFFWGHGPASTPFFGGTLCVQPPLRRTTAMSSGGSPMGNDCSGTLFFQFRQSYMQQQAVIAGDTVYGQFWFRDPGFPPPDSVALTDAIRFGICP